MLSLRSLPPVLLLLLTLSLDEVAWAQGIVRDDTAGAGRNEVIAPSGGNDYVIRPELGLRPSDRPDLLLHSFRDFNLQSGEVATFTGPESIDHIIARVTGGSRSTIDGTLRSTIPDSSLYFLNPAGILFGPNASLDVPGSFYAGAASQLRLGDGALIDAASPKPLLSTAAAGDFGFLNPTGAIEISGSRLRISRGTLGFTGTEILIGERGSVSASRAEAGRLFLEATNRIMTSLLSNVSARDDLVLRAPTIELIGGAVAASKVELFTDKLFMRDARMDGLTLSLSSRIMETSQSSLSGAVDVRLVGDDLEIYETTIRGDKVTIDALNRLELRSEFLSPYYISADELSLRARDVELNGALVKVGDIRIESQRLHLDHGAELGPPDVSLFGKITPRITVRASDEIVIRGESRIFAPAIYSDRLESSVTLTTGHLLVEDSGFVSIGTKTELFEGTLFPVAAGGTLRIDADQVIVRSGGQIDSSTLSESDGGTIDIHASKLIEVSDAGSRISAITGLNGRGGRVFLSAPRIVIRDRARVSAEATVDQRFGERVFRGLPDLDVPLGGGNAGLVSITGDVISIEREAQVSSATAGRGNGGAIRLAARDSIRVSGGSQLTARSTGTGNAGSIELRAGKSILLQDSTLATSSLRRSGGDILVDAKLVDINNSIVSTDVGPGDSGNIEIRSEALLLRGESQLAARAGEGTGGRISIQSMAFLRGPATSIDASSDIGIDGSIDIRPPTVDLSASLAVLASEYVDASDLLVERCHLRDHEDAGSFRLEGREGMPEVPQRRPGARHSHISDSLDPADRGDFEGYMRAVGVGAPESTPVAILLRSAEVLEAIGELVRGRELLTVALERATKAQRGSVLALRGRLWARSAAWGNAERDLTAAEREAEALGDAGLLARILLDRGHLEEERGRFETARTLHMRAIESAARAEDHDTLGRARIALAQTGEEITAALDELAALPPTHDRLFARLHAGIALGALPEDPWRIRAGDAFVRVAMQAQDLGDDSSASHAWGELARLYTREGRIVEAIELMRRALTLIRHSQVG